MSRLFLIIKNNFFLYTAVTDLPCEWKHIAFSRTEKLSART